jgi:hypothetical protein
VIVRRRASKSLSIGSQNTTSEDRLEGMNHSKLMGLELDEASNMMAMITESLNTDFTGEVRVQDVKRRSRTLTGNSHNRLGIISTLSTSEPGETMCI